VTNGEPVRERGRGVRVELPVSRTLNSPRCGARGTIRRACSTLTPALSRRERVVYRLPLNAYGGWG
jgi:hypothetical protein